jgi:phage terminase large subunit
LAKLTIERPNPKQAEFFRAKTRFVAYGGARGGGKSWALRRKALLLCLQYPGIQILLIRRTYPELRENHVIPLQRELAGVAEYRETAKCFLFSNGSRIQLGYCDKESHVLRYQGQEYDVLCIDEATQLSEQQFAALTMIVRGVNDFPKRIYMTCNPGGVGHYWVKRLFVDRNYRDTERPEDYTFIKALAADNLALLEKDPAYLAMLDNLPDGLREAWRDGRWDVFSGQYFTEFDPKVHVVPAFAIPRSWRRYVSLDYGLDMLAAYWIAEDPAGNCYVYRELYEPGLIISEAAEKIVRLSEGEPPATVLAPPDLWSRQRETGKTTAEIFAERGLLLTQTGNNRVDGWLAVKEELKVSVSEAGEKTAALRMFPCCKNLIRCLPLLRHDEKNPNDVANEPHELTHGPDALRGFCSYRRRKRPGYSYEDGEPLYPAVGFGGKVRVI